MKEQDIEVLKRKHRKVYEVTVEDGQDVFTAFFRRPDMETMASVNAISKKDEVKGANVLFENCWLGGDELIREDAVLKMAAIGQLNTLMNGVVATIKNV